MSTQKPEFECFFSRRDLIFENRSNSDNATYFMTNKNSDLFDAFDFEMIIDVFKRENIRILLFRR